MGNLGKHTYRSLFYYILPVVEGDVGELLPSLPVDRVFEARVVTVELTSVGEDLVGEPVKILDGHGKPRDAVCNANKMGSFEQNLHLVKVLFAFERKKNLERN